MAVEHMPPGWVSHDKGAVQLLDFLKSQVRAPTLAEAGRSISRFFYGIKRRKGEGMAAWVVRHDEALMEAKRTLAEAIQEYGQIPKRSPTTRSSPPMSSGRMSSGGAQGGRWQDEQAEGTATPEANSYAADDDAEERADEPDPSESGTSPWDGWSNHSWRGQQWWNWWDSGYYSDPWQVARSKDEWSRSSWEVSEAASEEASKFLPDFVVAWMLLQRSGLDTVERSVIVANLKNQFTTHRVREALKLTWPDEELRRRDATRQSALFAKDDEEILLADMELDEDKAVEWEEGEEEEQAAYQALELEARTARRTLRDARERQSMMRKNRKFYPNVNNRDQGGERRPPLRCFRCGGPHLKKDCPEKPREDQDQRAHFVFSAAHEPRAAGQTEKGGPELPGQMSCVAQSQDKLALLALERIIAEGKAIIDGGATSSLASEEALATVAHRNWEARGSDGLEITPGGPCFRFGNGGRQQCLSTATMEVPLNQQLGRMRVHVHEVPGQPVLLSVQALKALKAVIDFETNQIVMKAVDPRKVAQLETTEGGHQLFPLVNDVLEGAHLRQTPFVSLSHEASVSGNARE